MRYGFLTLAMAGAVLLACAGLAFGQSETSDTLTASNLSSEYNSPTGFSDEGGQTFTANHTGLITRAQIYAVDNYPGTTFLLRELDASGLPTDVMASTTTFTAEGEYPKVLLTGHFAGPRLQVEAGTRYALTLEPPPTIGVGWYRGNPDTDNYVVYGNRHTGEWTKPDDPDFGLAIYIDTYAIVPEISKIAPLNNATGVDRDRDLSATFSVKMNPYTISGAKVKLWKGRVTLDSECGLSCAPEPRLAKVTYKRRTNTVTLDPAHRLKPRQVYTAYIDGGIGGVEDLQRDPLQQDKVWTFKTGRR